MILFPNEHLLAVSSYAPWFAHIVNFIVTGSIPEHWNRHRKDKFFHELKYYFWEEPLLCSGRRTRKNIIDVSFISMWRTFCRTKDSI